MKQLLIVIVSLLLLYPQIVSAGPDLSGKVVETMDSGGYTYICIGKKRGENMGCCHPDESGKRSEHGIQAWSRNGKLREQNPEKEI